MIYPFFKYVNIFIEIFFSLIKNSISVKGVNNSINIIAANHSQSLHRIWTLSQREPIWPKNSQFAVGSTHYFRLKCARSQNLAFNIFQLITIVAESYGTDKSRQKRSFCQFEGQKSAPFSFFCKYYIISNHRVNFFFNDKIWIICFIPTWKLLIWILIRIPEERINTTLL